jgi:autotransporter-associated beta strand protein/T5SS/PEP-CTERM-associated repeat protein
LADSFWQGGTADFNNPADWNPAGVPEAIVNGVNVNINADNNSGSNNVVLIQPGDPVWSPWDIRAGDAVGSSGAYVQTGDTLNVGGWFRLADGTNSFGSFILSNGVVNCALQAHVGEQGYGYLEIDGGTFNVAQDPFCMGDNDVSGGSPTGIFVMNGGTVNTAIGVELWLGEGNNNTAGVVGTGTMYMNGGAVNIGSWFAIGRFGGIGDLEMTGGSITMIPGNPGNITLGTTPGTGVINQSGGAITNTATQTWVCETEQGTWNLNGGWAVLGTVHVTQNGGANGTFNLNGGDLVATEITDNNGGAGVFNFNGGTLHAGTSTPNLMHDIDGAAFVQANGAKINTEGYDATISQSLTDGGGGLTKLGAGTLTLSGANGYSGPTIVSNGILLTSTLSFADGTYTVEDGAGFGVVVAAPGGQFTPSALTLGNTTGSSLNFDLGTLGNPTAAPLMVNGNLAVNGTTTVNIADGFQQLGQFPLVQYSTKSGSGTFVLGTLPEGMSATLVNGAGMLSLNITAIVLDEWDGLAGGNWDINLTTNWVNFGTQLPVTYKDGDAVLFDDTATGTTVVNVVATNSPVSLVFNNSTNNYTLVGTGTISGPVKLIKEGVSTLAIYNTNHYTGATILDSGTVVVTNLANGGVPSPIGASSASPTNLVLNGGTLSYQGVSASINRGYSLQGNYGANGGATPWTNVGSIDTEGNVTISGQVTAANNSSFVKTGPGTLTYIGAFTNQLSGGNDPGYQVAGGTLVFDGSAGNQVNHSQQEFWIGDTTNSGANIILTNTTLNVDSWFSLSRGNGNYGWTCNANFYNSTLSCGNFSLGWWNNRPNLCSQNFTMTNSTIIDGGAFYIAESAGSTGVANITGNSVLSMGHANPMLMGLASGATGSVVVANSSIVTNFDWLSCGANGYGTLTLKDNAMYFEYGDFNFGDYGAAGTVGILTIQDNAQVVEIGGGNNGVYVGKTAQSIGTVYQSGNSMVNTRIDGVFQLGQQAGAVGTWYQSGGTNYAGGWVSIGRGYNGTDLTPSGLLVVSGGLFDQTSLGNGLLVGEQGTGTLLITNSGVVISEANNIGVAIGWNGGAGEVDLGTGGTLIANFIQSGIVANNNPAGVSTFNFNGGLLKAGANTRLNFMSGLNTATILSGATIDTGANTLSIAQALLDGGMNGGLTKLGSGTLLLDGANTYTGTTTVSAGSLGGSGTIAGPLAVSNGATLAPGDMGTNLGTLTLNGSLSLGSSSTTVMGLNAVSGSSDQVTSTSTINFGGTLMLQNVSGALTVGQSFKLFTAGTLAGTYSSVLSQTPGQTVTWDTTQLYVNGTVKVASVIAVPVAITATVSGTNISLTWPAQTGWELQEQTNSLSVGIGNNWVAVPGSAGTNQFTVPVNPGVPFQLFRLIQGQ